MPPCYDDPEYLPPASVPPEAPVASARFSSPTAEFTEVQNPFGTTFRVSPAIMRHLCARFWEQLRTGRPTAEHATFTIDTTTEEEAEEWAQLFGVEGFHQLRSPVIFARGNRISESVPVWTKVIPTCRHLYSLLGEDFCMRWEDWICAFVVAPITVKFTRVFAASWTSPPPPSVANNMFITSPAASAAVTTALQLPVERVVKSFRQLRVSFQYFSASALQAGFEQEREHQMNP